MPLVKDETIVTANAVTEVYREVPEVELQPIRAGFGQPLTGYDLHIQRQISYAGILQAVLSSQVLAQIPFTTREEILDNAFFLARESYKHLKEETK